MSLNILSDLAQWNAVANIDHGDGTYTVRPEAMAYIVNGSRAIGLDVLDEKTADEWLARMKACEIVDGPWLWRVDEETNERTPVPLTMDSLRPFFGTRTNNFPARSRAYFNKNIAIALMEKVERQIKRDQEVTVQ